MTLCTLIKKAHLNGKEEVKKYGERLWKIVDEHPETYGLYIYSGTNIPLSYVQGFGEVLFDFYFSNKNKS